MILATFNDILDHVAKIIWDKKRNPTHHVSDRLGIERWQLGAAIHKIKGSRNLGPADRVVIYDDGAVRDENGEPIGSIHDEI